MGMTAHDVRKLRACAKCGDMTVTTAGINTPKGTYHCDCAFEEMGLEGVLKLPREEIGKFTAEAIGWPAMKQLCEAL